MVVCPECGVHGPEWARFCAACGAEIASVTPRETRKTVSILFCDVAGSTRLGEHLDPETFRRVLTRYYATAQPVLESHGGRVAKFVGDAILAVFGIPTLHEDDALRAVRAAAELRRALHGLNEELERDLGVQLVVRTGIHTGEVAIEDMDSGQPVVLGDTVNVAARLEESAGPDEIVIGATTWWLVRDGVSVEPLGPLALKGRNEPIAAYRLLTVFPSLPDQAPHLDVGIIGRKQEQALLRLTHERAVRESTCHLVTVLGPAGVGKSRLVYEFSTAVAEEAMVLRGRCLAYGDGITFWPIAVAVRQAAGISGDDSPEVARARLVALVGGQEDAERIAAMVSQILGLAEPGGVREDIFWGLRTLLETLARQRPLVLVVDDLQWAEPTLLDLIEHVAELCRDAPILIVCLARPELLESRPTWGGGKLNAASILLSSLTDGESEQLVAQLLGKAKLAPAVTSLIVRMTEGNPLFIEETVATTLDAGQLAVSASGLAGNGVLHASVPPTIQALLGARLDRLYPEERAVLERAAVIGTHFPTAAVLRLSDDMTGGQVRAILHSLVRKELIRPYASELIAGEAFRFRHSLIKDTAYGQIPKGTRALLHERLADWEQQTLGDGAIEVDEIIGYHLSEAYRYRTELGPADERSRRLAQRAGERLATAGHRAARRGDIPATVALLNRAVTLLYEDDPGRLEALLTLADALRGAGELGRATSILDTAINAATKAGDTGRTMHAVLGRLNLMWYTDLEAMLDKAPQEAERAIQVFEKLGDDSGLSAAWRILAQARLGTGQVVLARDAIDRAGAAAQRAGNPGLEARALGSTCWIMHLGPMPLVETISFTEEILTWARRTGIRHLEVQALVVLARAYSMRGEFAEAREALREATAVASRLGEVLRSSTDANSPAFVELLAGDYPAAERVLRRNYETLVRLGIMNQSAAVAGLLARVLFEQGRVAEAEYFAGISQRNAARRDVDTQVKWRRVRAKVLASRYLTAEAERLVKEEVAVADTTEWLDLQAEARVDLAWVLRLAGRPREAITAVEHALGLYQRKGNVVAAKTAHALQEDLRAATAP